MPKQRLIDGKWAEGKASPELLPAHLRRLPGELVTKEDESPEQIHELDPPHIARSLTREFCEREGDEGKETADSAIKKLRAPGPGEKAPVTQWYVDVVRMRVISTLVNKAVDEIAAGLDPDIESPFHLWFPENNANHYELRKGPAPGNRHRPKHAKHIDLDVRLLEIPRSMQELLKAKGFDLVEQILEQLQAAKDKAIILRAETADAMSG